MPTQFLRATPCRFSRFPSFVVVTFIAMFLTDLCLADVCTNNTPPVANAGPDKQGAIGASLSFDGTASSDPDGQVTSYWWNFGDGNFTGWQANAAVPHTYASAGTYTVRLWARDNCQIFSSSDQAIVTIANAGACAGNQAPTAAAGNDRNVTVNENVTFSASGSSDPDGSISSYSWNFGDGQSGSGANVSHAYATPGTYSATLTVTDNCSASSSDSLTVTVSAGGSGASCTNNQSPTANAGPDQQAAAGSAVALSGSFSTDPNNNIQDYWWNFGDGQFTGWQTQPTVTHTYANVGNYSARLWVRDACGSMSPSDTVVVNVGSGGNNNPCLNNATPTANAGPNLTGAPGQPVAFSGQGSTDPDGSIQSYAWNFGNAQTGTGSTITHTFASAGTYTVTLTVTDNCNATHSDTTVVTIQAPNSCQNNTPPTANAGPDLNGTVNSPITLNGSASSDANGTVSSYWFNFGDGSSTGWQNSPTVSHAYVATGNYNARLWVRDNCGAMSALDTVVVSVAQGQGSCQGNEAPVAVASGATEGHVGEVLTFTAAGSHDPDGQTLTYHWTFSDGQSANGATVSRSFSVAGTIIATLIATDPCGAQDPALHECDLTEAYECVTDSQCADDALFCNGAEICVDHECVHEGNPCVGPLLCNESSNQCVECLNSATCSDGIFCNGAESCNNQGVCVDGVPPADGSPCGGGTGWVCDDGECTPPSLPGVNDDISVWKMNTVTPHDYNVAVSGEIELGLRVKFRSPHTTGANLIMWSFMNGQSSNQAEPIHAFATPGNFNVTLVVYNQYWVPSTYSKTITVSQGMQFLSALPFPGMAFRPRTATVVGNEAWTISWGNEVGVFRIDDPEHLNTNGDFEIVYVDLPYSPQCISSYGQHLYIPTNTISGGVRIYKADRDNFVQEGQILGPALTGSKASAAVVVGNALYVGVLNEPRVLVYNLSNPLSPTLVTTLTFEHPVWSISPTAGDALGVRHPDTGYGGWRLSVVDVRAPLLPTIVGSPIQMPSLAGAAVPSAAGNVIVAPDVEGLGVVETDFSDNGSPAAEIASMIQPAYLNYVVTNSNLYSAGAVSGGFFKVNKYNIVDPHDPYTMMELGAGGTDIPTGYTFVAEVTGYGQLLFVGLQTNGFSVYNP